MNLPPIEKLQAGDSEAWDVVFEWLWPKAINISSQTLNSIAPSDAEDVVIEAFTLLFQHILEVHSTESLPSLLVAMANNRARNHLRRLNTQKRDISKTVPIDSILEGELHDQQENPLESLETAELYEFLEQIRMELHERSAIFIHECYIKGLSHRVIAESHGVTVSAVSGSIRRGLRTLREKLEKNLIFREEFSPKRGTI